MRFFHVFSVKNVDSTMKHLILLAVLTSVSASALAASITENSPAPACDYAVRATTQPWGVEVDVSNLGAQFCPGGQLTLTPSVASTASVPAFDAVRIYAFDGDQHSLCSPLWTLEAPGQPLSCSLSVPAGSTVSFLLDTGGRPQCVTATASLIPFFISDAFAGNNSATACTQVQRIPFAVTPGAQ